MTSGERSGPPPAAVLRAFGVEGPAVRLRGGRGTSWRAGDLVLKPADRHPAELAWAAAIPVSFDRWDLRVARPVRADRAPDRPGAAVVDGWTATAWLPGAWEPRWSAIVGAGDRFHGAVASIPRPDFLGRRTDPWSVADRVAWGEVEPQARAHRIPLIAELMDRRRELPEAAQLIHGDLTGNVLFHDPEPPAVIDLAPYWRPTGYATAIVLADALAWHDAGPEVLEVAAHVPSLGQHLVRALLFRAMTDVLGGSSARLAGPDGGPYAPVLAAVRLLLAESG